MDKITTERIKTLTEIFASPLAFLEFIKIQEPGKLQLEYEPWGHLVEFYQALELKKLIIVVKSKQIGICLDPSTLVLTADLRWVTLASVQEGDILVGVDEFAEKGQGKKRQIRKCEVLEKSEIETEAYLIETTKGNIIATGDHRFLADAGKGWVTKWRSIKKAQRVDGRLRPGYKIRMVTEPWGEATYEDGWFGGMLDGEGCLRRGRSGGELIVSQAPGVVLERCWGYLLKYPHYAQKGVKTATSLGGIVYNLSVTSLSAIFELVGKCRPSRFVGETYWWEGKALPNQTWGTILSIKPLGIRRMIDLMTSTGTFIANGFVSHNSWGLAVQALRKIMTTPGSNILMLSSGEKEAQALLEKSRIIYHNLPEWLKQRDWGDTDKNIQPKYWTLEPDSSERFGIKEMGSVITALASTEKAGIGQTSDLVIHDEAEFHDYFEVNLGHTLATVADKLSRQLVIVSTVDKSKPDSPFKRLFKGASGSGYPEAGSNSFQALFYPYSARPGRDEAFLEEQRRLNKDTPWVVEGHYPSTISDALSPVSVQSCFNKSRLDRLWEHTIEPEVRQGFIYILCPPRVGLHYVAGVDVGEGVGLDYSCLSIIGKEGLVSEVVAVIYTNTVGTDAFAFEVDRLCREYFSPLLVLDNIGIGRAVSDKLVQLGYPNLFYGDTVRKKVGWSLTRPNKRELAVKLVERINNGSLLTRFKPQVKELIEYQWVNGYPEPTGKTHGDTVISLMLAGAVLDKVAPVEKAKLFVGGRRIW